MGVIAAMHRWTPTGTKIMEPGLLGSAGLLLNGAGRCVGDVFDSQVIESVEHTLRIMTPIVESRHVVDQMIACRERGVKVRVLTDLADKRVDRQPRFRTTGMKPTQNVGPESQSHAYCRRLLGEGLVHCRGCPNYVHAKLWIVDDKVAYVGSVNLTDNSLGYKPGAVEVMIPIDDPMTVVALRDSFDAIWKFTPFRQHLHGEHLRIERKDKAATAVDSEVVSIKIRSGTVLHWNIPGRSGALLDAVVGEIEKARTDVVMCARSFVDLNEVPKLLETIHSALRSGVEITVIVAQDALSETQYPDAPTRSLLAAGLLVRGWPGLHVKGVLVDGHVAIVLSANFNPSLNIGNPDANIECGITCSTSDTPFRDFQEYLLALRKYAPYQLAPTT